MTDSEREKRIRAFLAAGQGRYFACLPRTQNAPPKAGRSSEPGEASLEGELPRELRRRRLE